MSRISPISVKFTVILVPEKFCYNPSTAAEQENTVRRDTKWEFFIKKTVEDIHFISRTHIVLLKMRTMDLVSMTRRNDNSGQNMFNVNKGT